MSNLQWQFVFNCSTKEKALKQLGKLEKATSLKLPVGLCQPYRQEGGYLITSEMPLYQTGDSVLKEVLRISNTICPRWYTGYLETPQYYEYTGTASNKDMSLGIPGLEFASFSLVERLI